MTTKKKNWLQSWAQPTVIMSLGMSLVIFGIWLVRIDDKLGTTFNAMERINERQQVLTARVAVQSGIDSKTAAILDSLLRQFSTLEKRMQRNESYIFKESSIKEQ